MCVDDANGHDSIDGNDSKGEDDGFATDDEEEVAPVDGGQFVNAEEEVDVGKDFLSSSWSGVRGVACATWRTRRGVAWCGAAVSPRRARTAHTCIVAYTYRTHLGETAHCLVGPKAKRKLVRNCTHGRTVSNIHVPYSHVSTFGWSLY